jgi:hypothetical protein
VSGVGNLFAGTMTGDDEVRAIPRTRRRSTPTGTTSRRPASAWRPSAETGWLARLLGNDRDTVARRLSIVRRNGIGDITGVFGGNGHPDPATRGTALGNITAAAQHEPARTGAVRGDARYPMSGRRDENQ